MHGRQKVERSEAEETAKEKERAKKLKAYQTSMKYIFDKREKGELDLELLRLTSLVLGANPDIATLWNIRREVLLQLRNSEDIDFSDLVTRELDLTETCLRSNPKSYGAWHMRYWLMQETKFERVPQELKLCAKYLTYDERNFHCWDYRRYLLNNSSTMSLEEEIGFTTEKIISNFSNYSSWHLRSTLLPRLPQEYIQTELELIKNAAYTDPNDQSVWLYHRWLLMSQLKEENEKLVGTHLGEEEGKKILLALFNIPVENPSRLSEFSEQLPKANETSWTNPWNKIRSKLWILRMNDEDKFDSSFCRNALSFSKYFDIQTKPKTPEYLQLLQCELEWVNELNEIEENNKWIQSTLILLMRLIDFIKFRPQIEKCLKKIMELDPKRLNYYLDLSSKFTIEWELVDLAPSCYEIDLSNLKLTSLYYMERLCTVKNINLSFNNLTRCQALAALVLCERLDLSGNDNVVAKEKEFVLAKLKNINNIS